MSDKKSFLNIMGIRTRLRPLKYEDLPITLDWRNKDEIRRWFFHSEILSQEEHLAFFRKYSENENDIICIIEEIDDISGEYNPVGQISLYNIDREKSTAELGRLMIGQPEARGKGYASESTKLLLDFAITRLGIKKICLEVYKGNLDAINIYKKHGFRIAREDNLTYYMVFHTEVN